MDHRTSETGILKVYPGGYCLGSLCEAIRRDSLPVVAAWSRLSEDELREVLRLAGEHPEALEAEERVNRELDAWTTPGLPPDGARGRG